MSLVRRQIASCVLELFTPGDLPWERTIFAPRFLRKALQSRLDLLGTAANEVTFLVTEITKPTGLFWTGRLASEVHRVTFESVM